MKRKRKIVTRKRRTPTKLLLNRLSHSIGKRIDFLVQEIEHLYGVINVLRQGIALLVEKHERDRASTISTYMDNDRLRRKITDATPPT